MCELGQPRSGKLDSYINPLSANYKKWSNTVKHFVADELFESV